MSQIKTWNSLESAFMEYCSHFINELEDFNIFKLVVRSVSPSVIKAA